MFKIFQLPKLTKETITKYKRHKVRKLKETYESISGSVGLQTKLVMWNSFDNQI